MIGHAGNSRNGKLPYTLEKTICGWKRRIRIIFLFINNKDYHFTPILPDRVLVKVFSKSTIDSVTSDISSSPADQELRSVQIQ